MRYYILRWKVITFRVNNFITFCVDIITFWLVLHFAAIITFCGVTHIYDRYGQVRIRNNQNGLETKISFDFQYFILNEHVYYLFHMPNKMKLPYQPLISAILPLGHELMP